MPKRTKFNNKQKTREEKLSSWAFFEQKRFEYLGANLKFLKEATDQTEKEHKNLKHFIESQMEEPKKLVRLPVVKLISEKSVE